MAQLGELDAQGCARARALAQLLVGRATQPDLFTPGTAEETVVPVRLDQVRLNIRSHHPEGGISRDRTRG
ncbi:MAG: hypothetical protein CV088_15040 [Nitrospira sp. LK70]|nr:hypothetical protein [Nitrospira sp. LK70]